MGGRQCDLAKLAKPPNLTLTSTLARVRVWDNVCFSDAGFQTPGGSMRMADNAAGQMAVYKPMVMLGYFQPIPNPRTLTLIHKSILCIRTPDKK